MKTITTAITVLPAREAINSEMATTISIDDDGGGPFVVVEQHLQNPGAKLSIGIEEWPAIRSAIEQMFESCKELESAS